MLGGTLADGALLGLARTMGRGQKPDRLQAIVDEVHDALALHDEQGWAKDPAGYHAKPTPPKSVKVRRQQQWEIVSYDSGYEPRAGEPGVDRWLAREANRTAILRVRRVGLKAPWLLLIHGAGTGWMRTDVPTFDALAIAERLHVNVVMPVLPLHGPRRTPGPFMNSILPSPDTLDTLHGLAQAAWDVRRCLAWIRAQSDASIGMHGISLGGYTAALTAGLEEPLAAVIAGVPLVDVTAVFASKAPARQRETSWFQDYTEASRQLLSVVSPLTLPPPRTEPDRLGIYAGRFDRFVPALDQAVLLSKHWGGTDIHWLPGGHSTHLRSKSVRRFTESFMKARLVAKR